MTLVEYYKQRKEPYEVLLSGRGKLHYHASEIQDGFYVIEQQTHYFPAHIKKVFRWDGGDYTAYQFQYSHFTGDWCVNVHDRGLDAIKKPYRLKRPYKLGSHTEEEKLQKIIIEIINQMREFNEKHDKDIYSKDIGYLSEFIQDSKLYMLE